MSILNSDKLARQSSVSGETKVIIAIQTKFAFGRRATLTLFGGLLLLLSACDAVVPPITIQNATTNDISVSFFYSDNGPIHDISKQGGRIAREQVVISPGESPVIIIGQVEQPQYTLVVKNSADQEMFRRTFLEEELDDRDWRITITPEGIQ